MAFPLPLPSSSTIFACFALNSPPKFRLVHHSNSAILFVTATAASAAADQINYA